ncbi:uncharacterized protein METZ01_LOCUS356294, partial [marine metagenome]
FIQCYKRNQIKHRLSVIKCAVMIALLIIMEKH